MGGLFSGGGGAPEPPRTSDREIQRAAEAERLLRRNAAGRASTLLTSGLGATQETLQPKTLLGQ